MYVADAFEGIIVEDDITPGRVPAERKASGRVLNLGRKPQDDGMVAMNRNVGVKATCMIFGPVVWLDVVGFVPSNDEGAFFTSQPLNFGSCRV
jgi:hypothetical protein